MAGAVAPNFVNRTMWTRDNLDVLRGLNSESIDLVYADCRRCAFRTAPPLTPNASSRSVRKSTRGYSLNTSPKVKAVAPWCVAGMPSSSAVN